MSGQQLADALEEGLLQNGILEGEILLQGLGIEPLFIGRMGQDALDFRGEDEAALRVARRDGIVKWLYPEGIPGREEGLIPFVPDGKGEHAPQALRELLAPLLVPMEQHLRVPLAGETVPGGQELQPKLLIIIDFPVEHQHLVPGFVHHGLDAAARVDDGKPPEAESRAI